MLVTDRKPALRGHYVIPLWDEVDKTPGGAVKRTVTYYPVAGATPALQRTQCGASVRINTVAATTGKVSNAADFESSSSEFLERADSALLSTGDIDFTVSAWVKLESKSDVMFIVSKRDSSTVQEFNLAYDNVSDRFTFATFNSAGGLTGLAYANNLGSPALNTWYFVTGWHDSVNNLVGIQINNGPADTVLTTGAPADTSANFRIGAFLQRRRSSGTAWSTKWPSTSAA